MTQPYMMTFWKGRPIEDLSKDELIEVINYMSGRQKTSDEFHRHEREFWRASRRKRSFTDWLFG